MGKEKSKGSQQKAQHKKADQRRADRSFQLLQHPRPQILGGDHRGSHAAANGDHHKNCGKRIGSPHCRKRFLSHEAANDHRIRSGI